MDYQFKKTTKSKLGKLGLYTALLIGIAAAGIGSYAAMRQDIEDNLQSVTDEPKLTLGVDTPATKETITNSTAQSTAPFSTETTAPPDNLPFTGSFTLPLGTEILKDYSDGEIVQSKTMGDWRTHNGIDFTGKSGDKVLAIQSGKVKKVYADDIWGTVVEIDHGNGMFAKYCGLKKDSTVKVDSAVKQGAEIGLLDKIPIEEADGTHLHLEITVDGKTVDPLAAMNRAE